MDFTPGWLCRLPQTQTSPTLRACPRLPRRPLRRQHLQLHLHRCFLFPYSEVNAEDSLLDLQNHILLCSAGKTVYLSLPLMVLGLTATDRAFFC